MSSFEPRQRADQVKSSEIVSGSLFVTGGDSAEVLDDIEEPLDEIALAVKRKIAVTFDVAVCFRRDHRFDGSPFQALDEAVAVVALVAEECCGLDLSRKSFCLRDVVCLSSSQAERERISQGVDDGMDFRRQAAARAAYGLVLPPFLRAPALC